MAGTSRSLKQFGVRQATSDRPEGSPVAEPADSHVKQCQDVHVVKTNRCLVGSGEWLGLFEAECGLADTDRSVAGLGSQDFDGAVVVAVTLAQHGAFG